MEGGDVVQVVQHLPVKVGIIQSSLHSGCICSFSYFAYQPVVHNWSIKGCAMCYPVCGKDPLLLIGKSSLFGDNGFYLKECHNDYMVDVQ